VLNRLLTRASDAGHPVRFSRRTLKAQRRRVGVMNARNAKVRRRCYRELRHVTEEVLGFADAGVVVLESSAGDLVAAGRAVALRHDANLGRRVVDQTRRRVLKGEKVAPADKVVSIFEPHTDIIIKGSRKGAVGPRDAGGCEGARRPHSHRRRRGGRRRHIGTLVVMAGSVVSRALCACVSSDMSTVCSII